MLFYCKTWFTRTALEVNRCDFMKSTASINATLHREKGEHFFRIFDVKVDYMWRSIGKGVLNKTIDVKVQAQKCLNFDVNRFVKYSFSYRTPRRFEKYFFSYRTWQIHWRRFLSSQFKQLPRKNNTSKNTSNTSKFRHIPNLKFDVLRSTLLLCGMSQLLTRDLVQIYVVQTHCFHYRATYHGKVH